jgi:hypothetical protein
MKVTKTYPLGDNGGCNGLAINAKSQVLFAACSVVGPPGTPNAVGASPSGFGKRR